MVKSGEFTLELVAADTKQAFKEHTGTAPDNRVFAEVEPDVEYFVRVASVSSKGVKVGVAVDGVHLGYSNYVPTNGSKLFGIFERKNGTEKTTALCFTRSHLFSKEDSKESGDVPSMWTGKVEAYVHYAKRSKSNMKDVVSTFKDNTAIIGAVNGVSPCERGKGVCSKKGSNCFERNPKMVAFTAPGSLLCKITLHYCTATGLIANNIIASPSTPNSHIDESQSLASDAASRVVESENAMGQSKRPWEPRASNANGPVANNAISTSPAPNVRVPSPSVAVASTVVKSEYAKNQSNPSGEPRASNGKGLSASNIIVPPPTTPILYINESQTVPATVTSSMVKSENAKKRSKCSGGSRTCAPNESKKKHISIETVEEILDDDTSEKPAVSFVRVTTVQEVCMVDLTQEDD